MAPLLIRALPEPLELLPQFVTPMEGKRHPPPPTAVALSKTCRKAVVCVGHEVRLVGCGAIDSLRSRGEELVAWTATIGARTTCCAFNDDESLVGVGDREGVCHLFETATGRVARELRHVLPESIAELTAAELEALDCSIATVCFSVPDSFPDPPDQYACTAGADGACDVWVREHG